MGQTHLVTEEIYNEKKENLYFYKLHLKYFYFCLALENLLSWHLFFWWTFYDAFECAVKLHVVFLKEQNMIWVNVTGTHLSYNPPPPFHSHKTENRCHVGEKSDIPMFFQFGLAKSLCCAETNLKYSKNTLRIFLENIWLLFFSPKIGLFLALFRLRLFWHFLWVFAKYTKNILGNKWLLFFSLKIGLFWRFFACGFFGAFHECSWNVLRKF